MTVGQGSLISPLSYVAVGRETALGTYDTCTSNLNFLSFGLVMKQENKILEEVRRNRVYAQKIKMGKVLEGDCEFYYRPTSDACNYILQNAFGGSITSATATGETVGGTAFEHQYDIGAMDGSYTSLCINSRRGQATGGKVFEYEGVRVNELTITQEIDDALKMSASFIGVDSSITSNDVESALTTTCAGALSFVNGRLSIEDSLASLTSTSFWHIQNLEISYGNGLKSDNDSRRIGSDILDVLPVGIVPIQLSFDVRFDTTTAYDAMLAGTIFRAEAEWEGSTLTGSAVKESFGLVMPSIHINEASEPEIGGPDEILKTSVVAHVLHDCSSAGGYALRATVVNDTASYS